MSTTVNDIIPIFDTAIGDDSTDRISLSQRYGFITEGVKWLQTNLDNDHTIRTYIVQYYDTLNYYRLDDILTDVFEGNALRRATTERDIDLTRKDARAIAIDISQHQEEGGYALERRDAGLYLAVNLRSKYRQMRVDDFDSLTNLGGTWTGIGDAINVRVDGNDGSTNDRGCLAFDANTNLENGDIGIINTAVTSEDLSDEKDVSSWLIDFFVPDNGTIGFNATFYWGSDDVNYYSVTQTTQYDGGPKVLGWNTFKFDWNGATVTGTVDDTAISYLKLDMEYDLSDDDTITSYKIDRLRLVRPEKLTFHYSSWNVGTDDGGDTIMVFSDNDDIPYYSGQYDDYNFAVAHKAASLAFHSLRLYSEANVEELEANKQLSVVKNVIPKSRPSEMKNFRVRGIRFERGGRGRGLRRR